MPGEAIITAHGITKSYGDIVAVNDVTFDVFQGEIFGLLGPNGAGKTTTLDCLEGLRCPDAGTIRVFGLDPHKDRYAVRERIGVQLQESMLQARIKVWEALDLFASFYQQPLEWEKILEALGLSDKRNALYSELSGGQKQRLFVALAMVGDADVLFLDELTTGLDPQARRAIWDLVRSVRDRGKTIVLTTHFMEEAERLCERVAIMDHGKIVAMDSPRALMHRNGTDTRIGFIAEIGLDVRRLEALQGVGRVELRDGRVTVHGTGEALLVEVSQALQAMECRYHDLTSEHATLEDVFLDLTGHQLRD